MGNNIEKPFIYLVKVSIGSYEDYRENNIFATLDEKIAEKWRDKYNRIVENNKERIDHYYDDENFDKPEPFWWEKLFGDVPIASIEKIKLR